MLNLRFALRLILLAFFYAVQFAPPAQAAGPRQDEPRLSYSKPLEITVGVHRSFYPHMFTDEAGKPQGYGIDVVKLVAQHANLTLTFKVFDAWSDLIEALRRGAIDVIPNFGWTDTRAQIFAFTRAYDQFSIALFTRKTNTSLKKVGDLKGKLTGVVAGNAAVGALIEIDPTLKLRVFENIDAALESLVAGGINALAYPISRVWAVARNAGIEKQIRLFGLPIKIIERGMAVATGRHALQRRLDAGLSLVIELGEADRLWRRWFVQADTLHLFTIRETIFLSFGGGGAILLTVFFWWRYRKLRAASASYFLPEEQISGGVASIALLMSLLSAILIFAVTISILYFLYTNTMDRKREELRTAAAQFSALIDSVARYNQTNIENITEARAATLYQIQDALGESISPNEITIARREGDVVLFLLRQHAFLKFEPMIIRLGRPKAVPMQRALQGQSGTMIGRDYRREMVIAAYQPIANLNAGLVVKSDLHDIQDRFVKVSIVVGLFCLLFIPASGILILETGRPFLKLISRGKERYRQVMEAARAGAWSLDPTTRTMSWDRRNFKLLGYDPDKDEASFSAWMNRLYPCDRSPIKSDIEEALAENCDLDLRYRIVLPNGNIRWLEAFGRQSEEGSLSGIQIDITEQIDAIQASEAAMMQTISAFSKLHEEQDPYTSGHQQSVVKLSEVIAEELDLSHHRRQGLRLAASIHDIGKIRVPSAILNRPGKLSPAEFDVIKGHPMGGYEILKDIDFPWPIAEMVRDHHEKLDGSGYPQGLKDGEISREAQIIGIADVIDAMAAHRPYRPALGLKKAMDELKRGRDTIYDADIVDICVRLYENGSLALLLPNVPSG